MTDTPEQVETTLAAPRQEQALAPQSLTPAQMLSIAVQHDAPVEKIEKLMELQHRWEANEARKAFEVAMVAFSARMPTILKTHVVDFTTSRGHTHYTHAGLPETVEQIQSLMAECQLSRRWADEDPKKAGNIRIRCIVSHITGHSESFAAEAPPDMSGNKNDAQAVASIITYLRRTTLFSVLGLVANDEVDNDGAGGKTTEPARPKSQDLTNKAAQDLKRQFCEVCREKAKDPAMSMAAIKVAYGAVATEIASDDPALCLECVQGANVAITADGAVAFLTEKVE